MRRRQSCAALALTLLAGVVAALPAAAQDATPPIDFDYTFRGDVPPEAVAAMEVVEDLLDDVMGSPVPIRVEVQWETGGNPNTLASAGPVSFGVNFPGAPLTDTEYPIALANALTGVDNTPGEFHITTTVNGDQAWDYRTGATAFDKVDFIGTLMHELLHGLGFSANTGCDGDDCFVTGSSGFPGVFDRFLVVAPQDTPLIDLADGSAELRAAILSNNVFWNGPLGVAAARSAEAAPDACGADDATACPTRPKIHAPSVFEPGSSMSHWDEFTYSANNPNAMMTAAGGNGETAQIFGPMSRAVMREIGWPEPTEGAAPEPEPSEDAGDDAGTPPGTAFDGNPATTERMAGATPTAGAIAMSQASFADDGAAVVTISRNDAFADALAASALGAYGPLLFTGRTTLDPQVRAEVDRVLAPGATVYVVGGTGAVSQAIEDELVAAGYDVVRLRGADRFETAVAIAREVHRLNPDAGALLFARGFGPATDPNGSAAWADSISAAAFAAASRNPLLLVQTNEIPSSVRAYLTSPEGAPLGQVPWVVLGGTSAVSEDVFAELGADLRVRGSGREATSIAIANQLFGVPPTGPRSYAIVHGRDVNGWGWGLAVAGVAGRAGAPILLVTDQVTPEVLAQVRSCGTRQVDLLIAGPTSVISSQVQAELDAQDGAAC